MRSRFAILLLACASLAQCVIIDKIAIVAGNSIVKDSDIDRDIRITNFLNRDRLQFDPGARKSAASRLLDQIFIRREIRIGDYPEASPDDAARQLAALKKDRFRSESTYQQALAEYGLNDLDLRLRMQWQLTVLQFIDARFRPAAYIGDDEVSNYYAAHTAALRHQFPGKTTLDQLREDIRNLLAGERINQLFFAWLDEQRKDTKVRYLEVSLQ